MFTVPRDPCAEATTFVLPERSWQLNAYRLGVFAIFDAQAITFVVPEKSWCSNDYIRSALELLALKPLYS